ncbi:unnamed protein product, partial [Prorocentrum cordatum]
AVWGGKLTDVRQAAVKSFKTTQKKTKVPYMLKEKELFEQQFPGRIEREGLKVQTKFLEGKWREVVAIRQIEEGAWMLDLEEIVGATVEETHLEAGTAIRANQAQDTFQHLAKKARFTKEEQEGAASFQAAAVPEEDEAPKAEIGEEPGSDAESNDDGLDDLAMLTSCVLDEATDPAKAKPTATKSAGTSSGATGVRAQGRRPTTTGGGPPPTPPSVKRDRVAEALADATAVASPQESDELQQVRKKFRGKTADELLEPHGWKLLQDSVEKAKVNMEAAPFNTPLLGPQRDSFEKANKDMRKEMGVTQKAIVSLDIKTKKW